VRNLVVVQRRGLQQQVLILSAGQDRSEVETSGRSWPESTGRCSSRYGANFAGRDEEGGIDRRICLDRRAARRLNAILIAKSRTVVFRGCAVPFEQQTGGDARSVPLFHEMGELDGTAFRFLVSKKSVDGDADLR
jgi:hypothetical protein